MLRALLRSPLLHFAVLGALLYAGVGALPEHTTPRDAPSRWEITIPAARIESSRARFAEQSGRPPSQAEVERMLEAEVEEEILFREAVARGLLERDGGVQTRLVQKMLFLESGATLEEAPALLARAVELGLHQEDVVVRRILVQKMRLLGGQLTATQAVSDADVARAYETRREVLRAPDRLSLTHVFLSRDRWGEATGETARGMLRSLLEEGTAPADGPERGDPFPLGHRLARRSRRELSRTFGGRFGEAIFEAAAEGPGRWAGPFESAYGLHLVFVEALEPGRVPPLPSVAGRLRLELEEERREANLDALLSDLRARYRVRLEGAPTESRDATPAHTAQETG